MTSIYPKWKCTRSTWEAFLLVLTLLLYLKPYLGIRHDSVLYLGQALLQLNPEQFGQDLFFAYGSQAQFTIFPPVVAWLLKHFNASELFLALTLTGRFLFAIASCILIRQLFLGQFQFWALLSLLIMPSIYGGYHVFSYGETFTTGRTFSEPLALLSLAAFVNRRWIVAAALWVLSALVHPLQALPVLLLVWSWLLLQDRRWLHLLWLPAICIFLGFFGFQPFSKLLTVYDPEWLDWIREANKNVYVTRWEAQDWCYLLSDVFFVWLLFRQSHGPLKKLSQALLLSAAIGFAASTIMVDLLQMVWPAGLQMWRIQWLLHWLAMASIPYLLFCYYRHGDLERPRLLMLLAIAIIGTPFGPVVTPWATLVLIPLFLVWPRIRTQIQPRVERLLIATLVLALLFVLAKQVYLSITRFMQHSGQWSEFHLDLALMAHPILIGSLVVGGLWAWKIGSRATRAALMIALLAWTTYAACYWDHRNDWTRAIESASATSSVFGSEILPGAQVYWEDELLAPWLILGRPSYYNSEQTAGLLFNRGTAKEASIRAKTLDVFGTQVQLCGIVNTLSRSNHACVIDETAVRDACLTSQGRLDYLVLRNQLQSKNLGSWTALTKEGQRTVTYYLYQCKDFLPEGKARAKQPVDYQPVQS